MSENKEEIGNFARYQYSFLLRDTLSTKEIQAVQEHLEAQEECIELFQLLLRQDPALHGQEIPSY